jgi:hypothetical protein
MEAIVVMPGLAAQKEAFRRGFLGLDWPCERHGN